MEEIVIVFYGKRNIDDYGLLNDLLLSFKDKENVPVLIFSLVSGDTLFNVIKEKNILKEYFDSSIKLYKQFYEWGYIEDEFVYEIISGKLAQIIYYIQELNKDYDIKRIYFIDDSELLIEIINVYAKMEHISEKMVSYKTEDGKPIDLNIRKKIKFL